MKFHGGMAYPDGESHMIEWLKKNGALVNGRSIYQWKKQLATYGHCKSFRVAVDIGAHVGPWSLNLRAAPGTVRIKHQADNSGASHVGETGAPVELRTLDSFNLADVDLIKMDVEGFEAMVIEGARETLLRCRPIVCCEQKRDFACKYGLKADAATASLKALGMRQIQEIGGDFIMGW